ncbi:MAG TPA: hypothetical protein PLG15_01985 [Candidatus Gastranaerophilaceae bacterium]|nr:hypothetical protein [Candidatus Gastranaerophilaceae bacterium]HPT41134.1 hypothetical protein [Candidatus Gastranaerophilaceae bacterium]
MSNPEEEKELGVKTESVLTQEGNDIEFEDTIDIDKIQQSLQKHLEEDKKNEEVEQDIIQEQEFADEEIQQTTEKAEPEIPAEIVSLQSEQELPKLLQNATPEIDPNAKKYVIYIDPENIPFMENLSVSERKDIINTILKEQEETVRKQKAINQRKVFMRHIIFASIVFIFGFPILFFVVNKSMEAVMSNYQQAEKNFSTLYKQKGKVQPFSPKAAEKFKY